VLGLALLLGAPAAGNGPVGAGFALLAAAGFAAMTVLGSGPVDGPDPAWTTGIAFTGAGVVLLGVALPLGGIGFVATPWVLLVLVAFAALPTALAYTLYFRGLATAPAAVGAVVALLEPLTGAVLAAAVLGERLGPEGMAGAVVLAAAVVLAGRSRGRARPAVTVHRSWLVHGGGRVCAVRCQRAARRA
jgi:DME family drug/metabolite transporter